MRKITTLIAVIAVAMLPAVGAFAQSSEGQVIVVHGVPDLDVDVYVNGELTLEGFQYGDVAGPLDLPEGTYDIAIFAAGADPEADTAALEGSAELPGGAAATIAAYLEDGGSPTLGVFVENNSEIAAGEARVTARHLADFGAVDILVDDSPVWEGVSNGEGADADLPAETYNIKITAAGDPDTVAFDQDVALDEGTNTIAYAIGSVEGESFEVVSAQLTGLGAAPSGVPTGSGGFQTEGGPWLIAGLGAMAALLMTGGALAVARKDG